MEDFVTMGTGKDLFLVDILVITQRLLVVKLFTTDFTADFYFLPLFGILIWHWVLVFLEEVKF